MVSRRAWWPSLASRADSADQGLADGAGDDAGVEIVTVIGVGAIEISDRPVVRFADGATLWLPSPRPATSSVRTRLAPESRSRSAIEPPIVTRTWSVESAYSRSAEAPTRTSPASKVRTAVTGRSRI